MQKAVAEGFISDANFDELIISDSCEELSGESCRMNKDRLMMTGLTD